MPSRKVSSDTFYPFVPARAETGSYSVMEAIKDVFVVVQGSPDASPGGGSDPLVYLETVSYLAGDYTLTFGAYYGDDSWEFAFTVTENQGLIEAQSSHATVHAVMIVDSDVVMAMDPTPLEVEPARILWATEQVDSVTFVNIQRLDGVEDASTEIELLALAADPIVVELGAGHNTEWSVDDDGNAVITVSEGIGLGRNDDYGDTIGGGTPPIAADNIVRVVNGIRPIVGDIPIETSESMGIETAEGIVTVVKKS